MLLASTPQSSWIGLIFIHKEVDSRTCYFVYISSYFIEFFTRRSDKGVIRGHDHLFEFQVESVRLMTAPSASSEALQKVVHHTGTFLSSVHLQDEGNLRLPIEVDYEIHKNLRELHNRLHSGGHILDIALFDILGFQDKLSVGKAYHFPEGPSIEYVGAWPMTPVEKQDMRNKLELACEQILATKANVLILFDPNDDREDNDGAMRYMQVEGFDRKIPCGGTHISNLSEISQITIRKIEIRSKILRIGYNVSSE